MITINGNEVQITLPKKATIPQRNIMVYTEIVTLLKFLSEEYSLTTKDIVELCTIGNIVHN